MTAIKSEIKSLLSRCMTLHGTSIVPDPADNTKFIKVPSDKAVKEFMTTLCSDEGGDMKAAAEKIIEAFKDRNSEAARSLNAARVWQVGNFIAAESVFRSAFFELVTLAPDEEPWVVNNTKNETRVTAIGEDGTPDTVRVVRADDKFNIGLYVIASDYVKYRTMDLYKGDITAAQTATFDISRDLTFKLDRLHYNLMTGAQAASPNSGAFGAFTYESATSTNKAKKASWVYLSHSGIVTSHLPSTNDFSNSDVQAWDPQEDASTGFRPAVLKVITSYETRWGNNLPDNRGSLSSTGEIIVPSSDIENMGKYLAVENGKYENSLQAQVQQNGYASLALWGKQWKFIPDITIPSGTCYPLFNKKIGLSFDKPNMAGEDVQVNNLEHWEKRAQSRAWGAAIISQWRPCACRIKYIP